MGLDYYLLSGRVARISLQTLRVVSVPSAIDSYRHVPYSCGMRNYRAATDDIRCTASRSALQGDDKTETPRCMRRAVVGGLCRQHHKMQHGESGTAPIRASLQAWAEMEAEERP